ncbi:MAG TPA: class I SAM-dependent methyltransferase [Candidatus Acidoferrum sp.]|jgi:hypothetical protein|nr:class I SAM-dependent methyltransferase [Candidatus Acidoferrum sp.]
MPQAPKKPYLQGELETKKFDARREPYWGAINRILEMGYDPADLIHHAPAFAGELNLGRFLALYEAYKLALPVMGHIAEAGVYIGSGTLFFAKLARLFEPASNTLVFGFDWFEGSAIDETHVEEGAYFEPAERVRELVSVQGLDDIVRITQLDLSKDLTGFFEEHPHLQFKLVFLDCGIYPTTKHCIEHFWPRLTPGGILVLDNYNHEAAPGETRAVQELLPDQKIRAFSFAFMASAYIIKE